MANLLEYVGNLHIFLGPYRGNPIALYMRRSGDRCHISPKVYPWNGVIGEGETPNKAAADFEEKWKARGLAQEMFTGPSWEGGIKPERPAPPKPATPPKPAGEATPAGTPPAAGAPPAQEKAAAAAPPPTPSVGETPKPAAPSAEQSRSGAQQADGLSPLTPPPSADQTTASNSTDASTGAVAPAESGPATEEPSS